MAALAATAPALWTGFSDWKNEFLGLGRESREIQEASNVIALHQDQSVFYGLTSETDDSGFVTIVGTARVHCVEVGPIW